MKRTFLAGLCIALLFCLSSCAAAANPLVRAQTTPIPGLPSQLHTATASEDTATRMEITLFFRYQQTGMLACETRTITIPRDESAELATVRQLLTGPQASHTDLVRLFPHNTSVTNVAASGDTLLITLSEGMLNDGIPQDWESDPLWMQEAPLRRKLTMQSLAATITENFSYSYVQVFIAHDEASNVSSRLDHSYFLDGSSGPDGRMTRDESLILTMQNTALTLLDAWQRRDYELLYLFTADSVTGDAKPVYQDFVQTLDQCTALIDFAASAGHSPTDSAKATVTLSLRYQIDGQESQCPAYPLRLVREDGVWKASYSELQRLMLRDISLQR